MIKIAIVGHGNLGRGVEHAIKASPDCECVGIYTRRDPSSVKPAVEDNAVYPVADVASCGADVLILCGGSATDLPAQSPEFVKSFNIVDSFDTHADIPNHIARVGEAARATGHTAIVSAGWDPGLFSLARTYFEAILPNGADYTFWGRGVSQGHSDAIRRIDGVLDARQYTVPVEATLDEVRSGANKKYTARQMHTRECFVVAKPDADKARIERKIKEMPKYFSDYDTTVTFISEEELKRDHSGLPHGGFVLRSGSTGDSPAHKQMAELRLSLGSNPEFTAGVLVACARACVRMTRRGLTGAFTMLDVLPRDLLPIKAEPRI